MIEARNLNKYFNRKKANEIHVINDTSLSFPETGLICLLGPSGSGKTTLLNVLGGLDKVDNGEIIFKDYSLKRYRSNKWDYIRNRHFGYIFQNYVLLPELTVYQNLEFVLKMVNLPKEQMEERINYALEAVGMEKYKKRKPTQLSGGQQQRIAIARALVKSPNVVIADEPTGNLDEKNTTQIMNIIKKISHECLVILVTHERRLAEFYGDIIYEVSDGKIVEERVITAERELYHLDDRNLYLKEFDSEEVHSEDLKIKYFFQGEKPDLNLNIIFKDGILYLNSDTENLKINFIDKNSEIKVIDSKKPVIRSENFEKFDYYLPPVEEGIKTKKSVLGFGQTLKLAFSHLGGMRRRQKLIYVVFFFSAIMICLGFMNLYNATNVDEKNFLYFNRNLVLMEGRFNDDFFLKNQEDLKNFMEKVDSDFILPHPNEIQNNRYEIDYFNQARGEAWSALDNSFIPIETVKKPKLVIGKLPEKFGEIAVDKYLADQMLQDYQFIMNGVMFIDQLLGIKLRIEESYFEIVGIINNNNPNFYLPEQEFKSLYVNFYAFGMTWVNPLSTRDIKDYYRIEEFEEKQYQAEKQPITNLVLKDNQVLVSSETFLSNNYKRFINYGVIEKREYEIVGIYESARREILLTDSEIDNRYYDCIVVSKSFSIYSEDKAGTIKKIEELELSIKPEDMYETAYKREKAFSYSPQIFTFSLIIIIASLIFLYFLMRSRLISRVYEVGVYRALGVKKANVYKIFLSEILVLTVFSATLGIGLVVYFVSQVNKVANVVAINFPWFIPFSSFTFMLTVNIFVGLLPVWNLLKLTPSQILSKYDI